MELPITPSFDEFVARCAEGNVIPIWTDVVCDLDTPVSAFLKVARHSPNHFLLESVEGGEKWGRYSFIGVDPPVVLRYRDGKLEITKYGQLETREHDDPLEAIREFLAPYRPVDDPRLPRFSGGLVGYLSYDAVRYIESLPSENAATDQPIAAFVLADVMLIFDHFAQVGRVVCNVHVGEGEDRRELYDRAVARIQRLVDWLQEPLPPTRPFASAPSAADPDLVEVEANVDRERYEEMVRQAKEYIRAGDAFQIVLSQRFRVPNRGFDLPFLYRTLRLINPSPYMFYLRFGDEQLVGASPEVMVRLEEGQVEVRPIAGTRPRGETPAEDEAIADELRADPKEVAEHIMLVDLGRNDVGRVAEIGSVRVSEQMVVERYSHVMHLVSNVRGTTRPEVDAIDVIRATFPAGTLSGAPKIRAMEIIEELEPTRRGVYGGAVGYLGFGGNMDLCIAIRTLSATRDWITVQAGAGIVYDSVPAREYDECQNKARALLRALAVARSEQDEMPKVLMIDNYDSFTFNLVQYLGELGADLEVVRNDQIGVGEILARPDLDGIVLSPGPCTPNEAGICLELVEHVSGHLPILGVCLGHQAIAQAFGGRVIRAATIMHGKTSLIHHDGQSLFQGLSNPFVATRYHSLVADREAVPECLVVTARTEDGEIMGLRHRNAPTEGIQFHPESILTVEGKRLLANYLQSLGDWRRDGEEEHYERDDR